MNLQVRLNWLIQTTLVQSQSQELLDAASDASIPRSIPDAAVAMQAMMGFQATDFVLWQIRDAMTCCIVLVHSVIVMC
jgi:hypothetical protein